jgi:DNA mismatch repair protein MutS
MFRQYLALKAEQPDALLFFRMGDFFELFFDDARVAAQVLELTLTTRNKNDANPIPMAGVPHHAAQAYVQRLIDAGHKVAIAEQVQDPREAKGIVDRRITRVVTPGVVLDPDGLDARVANYLAAVVPGRRGGPWGVAFLDVSTGDLRVADVAGAVQARVELERLRPREVLVPEGHTDIDEVIAGLDSVRIERASRAIFRSEDAVRALCEVLGVASLSGQGVPEQAPCVRAAGAVVRYARENSGAALSQIRRVRPYHTGEFLILDSDTSRNLEIREGLRAKGRKGTLLHLLDRTGTPMGGRKLREWLAFPLVDPQALNHRLDGVEALVGDSRARERLREALRGVADVERIAGKVVQGTANARDLAALRRSLEQVPQLVDAVGPLAGERGALAAHLPQDLCTEVAADLARWLVDEPPISLTEGGLLCAGVDEDIDALCALSQDSRRAVAAMEARERKATGIPNLRVRYNRAVGYFIEITRARADRAPDHYLRRQSLTNVERFITPELKSFEERVLSADERRKALEYERFVQLRDRVQAHIPALQVLAGQLAVLDVLAAFADLAVSQRYCRPVLDPGVNLELIDARHPVVEVEQTDERFVPNSVRLDDHGRRMVILTGPNMAGKSTIMRQVGLICLMAQIGCFVPAKAARIGICDRIFVRVGASDDLAGGRSTFMVEMSETANILHNATDRSLVLLDEIGRGTSTYDGVAIAWAVAEALHDRVGCRAIFATHYHELASFAQTASAAVNMRVAVSELGDKIIFLRRLEEGAASRSYGIQCARLAGMPADTVERAKSLLTLLETRRPREDAQLSLFESEAPQEPLSVDSEDGLDRVCAALEAIDPDVLSPREALAVLYELKEKALRR